MICFLGYLILINKPIIISNQSKHYNCITVYICKANTMTNSGDGNIFTYEEKDQTVSTAIFKLELVKLMDSFIVNNYI